MKKKVLCAVALLVVCCLLIGCRHLNIRRTRQRCGEQRPFSVTVVREDEAQDCRVTVYSDPGSQDGTAGVFCLEQEAGETGSRRYRIEIPGYYILISVAEYP